MKIDFNNVRRQALASYSHLVEAMNKCRYDTSTGHIITIPAIRIQEHMDDLRSALVGIGATYQEGDPDFVSVLDEKTKIPEFNPNTTEEE